MRRSLVGLLVTALLLAACGPENKPAVSATPAGPVKIQFWHAMSGVNTAVVNGLVERFNSSQKDVVVEAVFQGDYDQTINKLKTGFQGGASANLPALVQIYDIGTRFMIDSKQIKPVQDFIDQDKFSTSDFEPNILAYYRVSNRLYGMPFNISTPLLYYNKNAFRDAGLDPEKPPRTFDEVAAAARTLTKKVGGRTSQYGMAIAVYGWFLEQLIAVQGAEYANNGNGRDKLATAVTFDNEAGVKALTWWKGMYQDGICANYGRPTANTQKAFDTGVAAMMIDSTAVLAGRIKGVAGKFEIGTGFLPRLADARGGVIPGGAAVWILKGRPAEEQQAAWKFVKFITAPAQQAYWHIGTGYFPIRKAAYDDATDKEWRSKYPQFDTAIDQLHKTPVTTATKGALLGVFTKARQSVEGAIEKALLNQATPQQALHEAAEALKPDLEQYNRSVR
jgi:sn-glycerol 3-phosphate transport system substrate-binding protein